MKNYLSFIGALLISCQTGPQQSDKMIKDCTAPLINLGENICNKTIELSYSNEPSGQLPLGTITCLFSEELFYNQKNKYNVKIGHAAQKQPLSMTFFNLNTKKPKVKGNVGESDLVLLTKNDQFITLLEFNSFGNAFVYTIYRNLHVAIYQKTYSSGETVWANQMIGTCY